MKKTYTYQESWMKAAQWLHRGNIAAERGQHELAEKHYEKSQKWHDRMNEALGNGDGSDV